MELCGVQALNIAHITWTENINYVQGWEPANFLEAPAPDLAPDFFPKRLRLQVFFSERLRLRLQGALKNPLRLLLLTIG